MWTLRVVIAALFAFVFFFCAVFFPFVAMAKTRAYRVRGEDRHCSTTPIIGTLAGMIAIFVAPFASLGSRAVWLWTPLVAEVGVIVLCGLVWKALGWDHA